MGHWRETRYNERPVMRFSGMPALIAFLISMAMWAAFIWAVIEFGR